MLRVSVCRLTLLMYLGLFACTSALAQRTTGDIAGDVTDETGAVLPNVTIKVESAAIGLSRTTVTSGTGNYRVPELPIGTYKVSASASGFKTLLQTVEVQAGAVAQAHFKMAIGQTSETVEVQGSAPMVELSPNDNNYVDQLKIENVPINGRDFNSLLAITPGVQRAPGGGFLAVSINGSRTTSNNYFIDGLYNNDRYYGDSAINETGILGIPAVLFPPEAIEEMSVQETPSAEFGVKGGAPILLNMKSGTNNWHGSATWVNHSGWGDADNYFSNHNTDNCASPGECKPTPIHNNQMNATIGGPLIKDKAFLFVYYEGQRYISTAVASRAVPTPADIAGAQADIAANGLTIDPVGQTLLNYFPTSPTGTYIQHTPTTASGNGFGVKFDYKLTPNHSLSVRYIFGDSLQSGPPFAGLPPNPSLPQDLFNSFAPSRAQMAGVSWTWNMGPNKILESRLGYTRFAQILGVNNKIDPKSLGIDTGPLSPADFGVPYVYMYHLGYGGYIGGVQGYPLVTRPDATWDWSEHFSWVKGNHTIKFGGNYQRGISNSIRNNARTGIALGYFSYYAPITGGVQDDVEQLLLGKADLADRSFGDTHRHIYQNSVGFYIQDDWKIKPRFTLTYGLRYEVNGTMRDTANQEANFVLGKGLVQVGDGIGGIHNVDYGDFGPRLGFAWDVFGQGKVAVRAGYSLTYDVPNFAAFASPYSFAHAHTGVFDQPNLGVFSVTNLSDVAGGGGSFLPPNDPSTTCYNPAAKAGDYLCFNSNLHGPLFGPDPTGTPPFDAFSVINNFKTPRYHNFNVSIQDELFRNNVLNVTYSGQRGRDLLIYHDLNASPLGSPCTSPSDCNQFRPFHGVYMDANGNDLFQHVIEASNQAHSQYDSLQVSYNQRGWHGLDTQYNLTWSKCYDDNSVNRGGAGDYPQVNNLNPVGSIAPAVANFADSRGLCDHDVRLNFNIGGVYDVPYIAPLGKRFGHGWQFSTIFTGITGRPFSALLTGNDGSGQGLIGNSIRAAWDGAPVSYNTRNPDHYVQEKYTNPMQPDPCGNVSDSGGLPLSPFYFPCSGIGNSRRNQLAGPGLSQWDMAFSKATKITERLSVELRWEVYNLLNHGNFYYLPNNILSSCAAAVVGNVCQSLNGANFGQINETSDVAAGNPVIAQGGPRNMNFVLKFKF
ncbi:MAG: TonB-dependent receptor domain-containing protein [Terriglobales bacterium]